MKTFLNEDVLIYIQQSSKSKKEQHRVVVFHKDTLNTFKTEWCNLQDATDLYINYVNYWQKQWIQTIKN